MAGTRDQVEGLPWYRAAVAVGTGVDVDAMDQIDTDSLVDRARCVVTGTPANAVYEYSQDSAAAADGFNVVAPASGVGRWILVSIAGAEPFMSQAAWVVDSVNGNDANEGTALSPIRTLAELARRWSGKVLLPSIVAATIRLLGTFPGETLSLPTPTVDRGQSLGITGALTTVLSGTITTYTARNAAGNASATILANVSFAGQAGRRIRLTSGGNAGATATVLADLGGNTCRVSSFASSTGSAVTPANGESFVIETYDTTVGGVSIISLGAGKVWAEDLEFAAQETFQPNTFQPAGFVSTGAGVDRGSAFFNRCRFSGGNTFMLVAGCGFTACTVACNLSLRLGRFYFQHGAIVAGSCALFNSSLTIQAGWFSVDSSTGTPLTLTEQSSVNQIADVQFFGCAGTNGIELRESVWAQGASVFVYGATNTFTTALRVISGSEFLYQNTPTIVGVTQDVLLGGAATAWGAIPAINAANNAAVVVRS